MALKSCGIPQGVNNSIVLKYGINGSFAEIRALSFFNF
jgi:hypothetical protein